MVTPGKSPITEVTLEGLHPRVFSVVSRQLVRPSKLPVTSLPAAEVRLLPSVGSLVGLQVTALGVNLKQDCIMARDQMQCNAPQ